MALHDHAVERTVVDAVNGTNVAPEYEIQLKLNIRAYFVFSVFKLQDL